MENRLYATAKYDVTKDFNSIDKIEELVITCKKQGNYYGLCEHVRGIFDIDKTICFDVFTHKETKEKHIILMVFPKDPDGKSYASRYDKEEGNWYIEEDECND